jgi:hypothetical protein
LVPGLAWLLLSGAPPGRAGLPLPPARAALAFAPDAHEVTLEGLLTELAHLTGQELAMSGDTRRSLAKLRVTLERTDPVPAEEVYGFVESMLVREGCLIAALKGGSRPVLGVALPGARGSGFPLEPLNLPLAQFDEAEQHPALVVRILLNLRHTDTRQLQTQLRQLLVDPTGSNNVVPAGERSLIMEGRAGYLVPLARQILEMDEAQGTNPASVPPAADAKQGDR